MATNENKKNVHALNEEELNLVTGGVDKQTPKAGRDLITY